MIQGLAFFQTMKFVVGALSLWIGSIGARLLAQIDGLGMDSVRDFVGGGLLLAGSVWIVRWVHKTSATVEEKWIKEVSRLEKSVEKRDSEIIRLRLSEEQWRNKYWELFAQYHGEERR